MTGSRVSDLAKELGIAPADLVATLNDLGVAVPGIAAIIDGDTAQAVREMYAQPADGGRVAEVAASATVKDLATALNVSAADLQKKLMAMGILSGITQRLAPDVAKQLAAAYGYTLKVKAPEIKAAAVAPQRHKGPGGGPTVRPPVVTIMGHVDHGKTTLLDAIRNTKVVDGEFGGITQHIGAYQVEVEYEGEKRKVTFLDTPGHAAFTAMRARGASVTDIAVLVVAADDGIMPQTVEAIDHARAAEVAVIIAINKMDRPDANPDRIKTQLMEHNLVPREYGGDIECLPMSAKTGQGIEELLELLAFQADVMELKADAHGKASGVIVEAQQEAGKGPVATVLVQEGTLRVGDCIVCGLAHGRIRAMMNERGDRLTKATPATPVEVLGLSMVPMAGDKMIVVKDEREARQTAEKRAEHQRAARLTKVTRVTLEDIRRRIQEGAAKELLIVLKGDVQGSVEAVAGQLQQLPQEEVSLRILHSGVGNIGENDVMLASAAEAVVIGFNVRADQQAQMAAQRENVDVRTYQIIYELTESVERAMKGMLAPIYEEIPLGTAEVRAHFRTPRGVIIAGCYVTSGKILRNAQVRIRRGRDIILESRIDSLKHIKDDVREMAQGFECGMVIGDYTEVQTGDIIEAYQMREVER
jgi:translation initiation factor IF-2